MNEQQAFVYLKSMVDLNKISEQINPGGSNKEVLTLVNAVDLLIRKLNKLESENAVLKSQKKPEPPEPRIVNYK